MDYNSPIYREKYLKYKKKYLELKALEDAEFEGAGFMSSLKGMASKATAGLAKVTGTDPQSKYNKEVLAKFTVQVTEVRNFGDNLVKGIYVAQQKEVTNTVYGELATGHLGLGKGKVAKAISAITGTHNANGPIPGVTVPSADDKLKEILKKELGQDTAMAYAKPILEANLKKVYEAVLAKIKTQSVKDANKDVNATSIKNLNDQVGVEQLCDKMGLKPESCDKKLIDAAKMAFDDLQRINKLTSTNEKNVNTFETSREKAQTAMDNFAKTLAETAKKEAPKAGVNKATLEQLVKDNDAHLKKDLLERLKITIEGEVTKESLINAFAKPDYKVPESALQKPGTPPASPKASSAPPSPNA